MSQKNEDEPKPEPKKLDCMIITRGDDGVEVERKTPHYFQWFWRMVEGKREMTDIRRCTTCDRLYDKNENEVNENGVLVKLATTEGLSPSASA